MEHELHYPHLRTSANDILLDPPRLVQDFQSQPASLDAVLRQQCGPGLPALLQAAKLLGSGKRVLITGMGASMCASIPFENLLCSLGVEVVVVEAAELLHYRHKGYRDAVVLMVSRSGDSVEVIKLIELLKGRHAIIGVSNESSSTLALKADVPLLIGSMADEMVALQSYTGTLLTLHLLAGAVANRLDEARAEVEAVLPDFSAFIATNIEQLGSWDAFLDPAFPVYLLARGPSYASASEGALLFNEIAKAPAVSMLIGSFRHGPVELVDRNFRGLIFAGDRSTRHLNLALAREITRFGGRVRVIGSALKGSDDFEWRQLPSVPEPLAPLFEIVPVQVAAIHLAQLRGVPLGSFRYVPQVARDEATLRP
jgi:glutamine---fructose-6-phosphate transaminase (isomerizing)